MIKLSVALLLRACKMLCKAFSLKRAHVSYFSILFLLLERAEVVKEVRVLFSSKSRKTGRP